MHEKAFPVAARLFGAIPPSDAAPLRDAGPGEIHRQTLWLITGRASFLFLGLNLAQPLGILPPLMGSLPLPAFFNILTVALTALYLALWRKRWQVYLHLYLQILIDLCLTTFLVANTRGLDSPFVSLYLLIIIYSSLVLGRLGGTTASALSVIFYASLVTASHLEIVSLGSRSLSTQTLTFRISLHALSFMSVAFLGTYLSQRLRAVQEQLEEKIDSVLHLQRLNERIVSSIRSGLITTDLHGQIALFNNAAEEITGYSVHHALGRPVQTILGRELWESIQQVDLMIDSRPFRHESWISMPDQSNHYLGFSVSPLLDLQAQVAGYIVSFQDLTEIKRLEEEVHLREKMAAIGRMAAGIAHEIRNPLTSIRGSAEVLRSRLQVQERDARLMDVMMRESDRLNNFVEEFLTFARPKKHPRRSVELVSLLKDTSALLENNPDFRKKHSIVLDLQPPPLSVRGNPDQLKQVFWNLAQNSLRAMPDGGTLTIQARETEDGGAQLVFRDTGVGMTQEEKDLLFQPFHSGFAGGTGLGLSIVFQIVDDHKGRISYESAKGVGTSVRLYLPPETTPSAVTTCPQ